MLPKIFSKNAILDWSANTNYSIGEICRGGAVLYCSKLASGPTTSAGAKNPANDDGTYWTRVSIDDAGNVHKTGNEVISGNKALPNNVITASKFVISSPYFTKGTPPSTTIFNCVYFGDKNARGDFKDCIGSVESAISPSGIVSTWLKVRKNVPREDSSELEDSLMGISYDENTSEFYATAPSTLTTRNYGYDILTRDWIPKDTRIVHTTGNEEISGNKTFNGAIISTAGFYKNQPDFVKGTNLVGSNKFWGLSANDSLGRVYPTNTIGVFEIRLDTNKNTYGYIRVLKNEANSSAAGELGIAYLKDDNKAVAYCPNTPLGYNNAEHIITRGYVNRNGSETGLVHTSMNETIDGEKTFLKKIVASDVFTDGNFAKKHNSVVKGTTPPSNTTYYWSVYFGDKNGVTWEDHCIGQFETALGSNNVVSTYMRAMKNTAGSSANCTISCIYDTNNNVTKTHAPTPPANDNSTQIANTSWVRNFHGGSSSDERLKSEINEIPDEVLDAWGDVSFCQFKFKNAINEKGNNARLHNGLVAQNLDRVFKDKNLDISKYGLFIHEEWEKEDEITDGKGNLLCEGRKAGEEYSLRYTEALCMEAAYQRRQNSRMKATIEALEQRIALLEEKINQKG